MSDLEIQNLYQNLYEQSISDPLLILRKSTRARRLLFKSSLKKGVEIVIPVGANISWVEDKVTEKFSWIKSSLEHIKDGRKQLIPDQIYLKAIGETWNVDHVEPRQNSKKIVENSDFSLTVSTDRENIFESAKKIQVWFQKKARDTLVPWIENIASDRKLRFNSIRVKNQTSMWGSCSDKRNINLNRNLLFISSHLVEYVLHHELTHLEHMDHSKRFWNAFRKALSNCNELKSELRSHHPEDLPLWASPGLKDI